MTRTETINWLSENRRGLCEEDQRAVDRITAALWGNDRPLGEARRIAAETTFRDPMAGGGIRAIVKLASE